MTTRVKQLATAMIAAPNNETVYTVPSATVTIVKEVRITNSDGASSDAFVQVNSSTGANALLYDNASITNTPAPFVSTYTVMNAGDTITCGVISGSVSLWISGTELPQG